MGGTRPSHSQGFERDSESRERRLTEERIRIEVETQEVEYWKKREKKREEKKREKRRELDEAFEMKFSHSIQFNAVPDWSGEYIAYSNLKKM